MTDVVNWKKALLVALVVLLVLIGLPILMPGGAMACPDCGPVTTAYSVCVFAVLAEAAIAAIALFVFLRRRTQDPPILLRAVLFDRPPRLG